MGYKATMRQVSTLPAPLPPKAGILRELLFSLNLLLFFFKYIVTNCVALLSEYATKQFAKNKHREHALSTPLSKTLGFDLAVDSSEEEREYPTDTEELGGKPQTLLSIELRANDPKTADQHTNYSDISTFGGTEIDTMLLVSDESPGASSGSEGGKGRYGESRTLKNAVEKIKSSRTDDPIEIYEQIVALQQIITQCEPQDASIKREATSHIDNLLILLMTRGNDVNITLIKAINERKSDTDKKIVEQINLRLLMEIFLKEVVTGSGATGNYTTTLHELLTAIALKEWGDVNAEPLREEEIEALRRDTCPSVEHDMVHQKMHAHLCEITTWITDIAQAQILKQKEWLPTLIGFAYLLSPQSKHAQENTSHIITEMLSRVADEAKEIDNNEPCDTNLNQITSLITALQPNITSLALPAQVELICKFFVKHKPLMSNFLTPNGQEYITRNMAKLVRSYDNWHTSTPKSMGLGLHCIIYLLILKDMPIQGDKATTAVEILRPLLLKIIESANYLIGRDVTQGAIATAIMPASQERMTELTNKLVLVELSNIISKTTTQCSQKNDKLLQFLKNNFARLCEYLLWEGADKNVKAIIKNYLICSLADAGEQKQCCLATTEKHLKNVFEAREQEISALLDELANTAEQGQAQQVCIFEAFQNANTMEEVYQKAQELLCATSIEAYKLAMATRAIDQVMKKEKETLSAEQRFRDKIKPYIMLIMSDLSPNMTTTSEAICSMLTHIQKNLESQEYDLASLDHAIGIICYKHNTETYAKHMSSTSCAALAEQLGGIRRKLRDMGYDSNSHVIKKLERIIHTVIGTQYTYIFQREDPYNNSAVTLRHSLYHAPSLQTASPEEWEKTIRYITEPRNGRDPDNNGCLSCGKYDKEILTLMLKLRYNELEEKAKDLEQKDVSDEWRKACGRALRRCQAQERRVNELSVYPECKSELDTTKEARDAPETTRLNNCLRAKNNQEVVQLDRCS